MYSYSCSEHIHIPNMHIFYWKNSKLHNILIYVLLSICNFSYHFEDNRVLNDILKRLYTFPRWMVSKVYRRTDELSEIEWQLQLSRRSSISVSRRTSHFNKCSYLEIRFLKSCSMNESSQFLPITVLRYTHSKILRNLELFL
jgi:hypothetical protein